MSKEVEELAEGVIDKLMEHIAKDPYKAFLAGFKVGVEAAKPKWSEGLEGVPYNTLLVGEFEIKPSYWVEPIKVFQIKEGYFYDQGGSSLAPEYLQLIRWMPLPEMPEDDDNE